MNTNGLAKHYEHLTPWERLPLIVAAADRGDDAEADRLMRSAPREGFRLPDYHGLAEGVALASLFHMMTQLDRIARYWRAEGIADRYWEMARGKEEKAKAERLSDLTCLLAYRITVEATAWKRFCAELKLDADTLLRDLPTYDTLKSGQDAAGIGAFTAEQVAAFLRKAGREDCTPPSVEDSAKEMRVFLDSRIQWWD
jgi:hypothetical protein